MTKVSFPRRRRLIKETATSGIGGQRIAVGGWEETKRPREIGNWEKCGALPRVGAVIAMAAVRKGARAEPGKVTDHSKIRPPTDVMAITPLPFASHPFSPQRSPRFSHRLSPPFFYFRNTIVTIVIT